MQFFNAITGKLESDVVVFKVFRTIWFLFDRLRCYFFCKKSSSFISVLQGKCHFSLLLSASSVIRSKYWTRHTSFNLKETRGSKSRGEYDISFLTCWCANATSHRFYDTYFRLLLHGSLLCRFMYWLIMNCFRRTSVWINSIYV